MMSARFGVGLFGPQRCGKTSLARACSQAFGMTLIETSISQVYRDMGYDPKETYSFDVRMDIQERILDTLVKEYDSAGQGLFITDRTPIDFLGYTMGDVMKENVTGALEKRLFTYCKNCFRVLNEYFDVIILVQPGIPVVEAEGKAPANWAHMEKMNALMSGFAASESVKIPHVYIPREVTNMAQRVRAVEQGIRIADQTSNDSFNKLAKERGAIEASSARH